MEPSPVPNPLYLDAEAPTPKEGAPPVPMEPLPLGLVERLGVEVASILESGSSPVADRTAKDAPGADIMPH
jgi:hypothetical protein